MKNILLLYCCCISIHAVAQNQEIVSDTLNTVQTDTLDYTPYPQGCYMSLEEILNKTPSKQMEIETIRRTEADIAFGGGSDYKLIPRQRSIKRTRTVKNEIWAVSNGTDLFLNTYKFGNRIWYAKISSYGHYLTFRGGLGSNRRVYIFDTQSGKIKQVNRKNIHILLEDYPSLLANFEAETNKGSLAVLEKYIRQINASLEQGSAYQLPEGMGKTYPDSVSHHTENIEISPYPEGDLALTIGILEGGSLIGLELEAMVAEAVGIEGGIGFRGFSLGMNWHFKDKLKSHALNVFFINQGFTKNFSQRLVGTGFTFRSKKGLTAHLGLAYALQRSEALADRLNSDVVLTFSLGFYKILRTSK